MLTNVSKIPNLSECFSNGDLGTLVTEVGRWNLGGEEELVTGELGVEKTLGGRSLVTVGNGGVDLLKCSFSICSFERSMVRYVTYVAVAVLHSDLNDLLSYIVRSGKKA